MISSHNIQMLEYKHYLENQYQKIHHKILGDESINIFKDLDNKEFMHRRVNEIFEKTYNAQRENYIKNLIEENNRLKQQINALGGSLPLTPTPPSFTPPLVASRHDDLEKTSLIKQNQQLRSRLTKFQFQAENQKEKLRRQIFQLQEGKRISDLRQNTLVQEWKQKESKLLESFKEFIQENKNLQTEILELKGRLDGHKLKQTVSTSDNQSYRKKLRQLEIENRELVSTLSNNLNEIKNLTSANTKLAKDYSFMQHKYKLLQQQKQQLQCQIYTMTETKQQELNENFRVLELQCEAKQSLIKKLESSIGSLNKELADKCEELLVWKENYQNSAKQNSIEKVKLKYEYEILELRNQLIANQQQYQRQLQKRSQRANNVMKEEVVSMETNKHREKVEYGNKISALYKEKYELQQETRALKKQIDELESRNRNTKMDLEKEMDRLVIQNESVKSSMYNKESQYRQQMKHLEEHISTLKKGISQQGDKINELQLAMVVCRRESKQFKQSYDRQTQRVKESDVQLLRKDMAMKQIQKQLEFKQNKHKQTLSALNIEAQEKNELRARLIQQKSTSEQLSSQINRLKVLLLKNESSMNAAQIKHRTQIKQLVEQHQHDIQAIKAQITLQVHQQMRALEQLSITEKEKVGVAGKYQRVELERLYQENNKLKEVHAHDMMEIKQLNDNLKEVQSEIRYIRDEESTRQTETKQQIDLLKQENESVLRSLMVVKSQNSQYRTKMSEFKQQTNIVIKGILKMFWEDILNIKEQVILFQTQQKHNIEGYNIEMNERVRQYANLVNNKLREVYSIECSEYRQKCAKEINENKEEWEQRCRKLQLDLMAIEAQRQMERSEINRKIKVKDSQIEAEQDNYDDLLRKNEELEGLIAKYPAIIKKLEEKNKQLSELVSIHKCQESKVKTKLQRQQERAKKVQAEYQCKLQSYKNKYLQDNQDLFNRYQRSLQQMITKTSISDSNLEDTLTFKTPLKKQTSITNLRQQISQQRNRLKQLSKQ